MNQSVGENIKRRRKELFLSVDDAAERTGVSRATWYRYEKGEIEKISTQVMSRIAQVLNTNVSELLGMDFENVKTSLFDNPEHKEWNVVYPTKVALHRIGEPIGPSNNDIDDQQLYKIVKAVAQFQKMDEKTMSPQARIIAAGVDKLPEAERDKALAIMRTVFEQYSDYFKGD